MKRIVYSILCLSILALPPLAGAQDALPPIDRRVPVVMPANPNLFANSQPGVMEIDPASLEPKPEDPSPSEIRNALALEAVDRNESRLSRFAKATPGLGLNWATFQIATGGVAALRASSTGLDPSFFYNFWVNTLTDPGAQLGFVGFVATNHVMLNYMNTVMNLDAMKFQQIQTQARIVKARYNMPMAEAWAEVTHNAIRPTLKQRLMLMATPKIAMTGGLLASSIITELYKDQDFRKCAEGYLVDFFGDAKTLQKDPEQKLSDIKFPVMPKPQSPYAAWSDACDRAYKTWSLKGMAKRYAPQLISNLAVAVGKEEASVLLLKIAEKIGDKNIQRGLLDKSGSIFFADSTGKIVAASTAEEANKILGKKAVLAGIQAFFDYRKVAVGLRFVVSFTQIGLVDQMLFLGLSEIVTPVFDAPWQRWLKTSEITGSLQTVHQRFEFLMRDEKNWNAPLLKAAELYPNLCGPNWRPRATVQDGILAGEDTSAEQIAEHNRELKDPNVCPDEKPLDKLVKDYVELKKTWRSDVTLKDFQTAHKSWLDNIINFVNMVTATEETYPRFARLLSAHAKSPKNANDLYDSKPLMWITLEHSPDPNSDEYRDFIKPRVVAAIEMIDKTIAALNGQKELIVAKLTQRLKEARNNFDMYARTEPTPEWVAAQVVDPKTNLSFAASMHDDDERVLYERRTREKYLAEAFRFINSGLREVVCQSTDMIETPERRWCPMLRQGIMPANGLGQIFVTLQKILGDPRPLPPGVATIKAWNIDPSVIPTAMQEDHPGRVPGKHSAKLPTPTPIDFLVASAVCGPEAAPTEDQIYHATGRPKPNYPVAYPKTPRDSAIEVLAKNPRALFGIWFRDAIQDDIALVNTYEGWKKFFEPPRLIAGSKDIFCDKDPSTKKMTTVDLYDGANRDLNAMYDRKWEEEDANHNVVVYDGFLDILRKKFRPELLDTSKDPDEDLARRFNNWWAIHVEPAIKKVLVGMQVDYQKRIGEGLFIPAFYGEGSGWHNTYLELRSYGNAWTNWFPVPMLARDNWSQGYNVHIGIAASFNDDILFLEQVLNVSLKGMPASFTKAIQKGAENDPYVYRSEFDRFNTEAKTNLSVILDFFSRDQKVRVAAALKTEVMMPNLFSTYNEMHKDRPAPTEENLLADNEARIRADFGDLKNILLIELDEMANRLADFGTLDVEHVIRHSMNHVTETGEVDQTRRTPHERLTFFTENISAQDLKGVNQRADVAWEAVDGLRDVVLEVTQYFGMVTYFADNLQKL